MPFSIKEKKPLISNKGKLHMNLFFSGSIVSIGGRHIQHNLYDIGMFRKKYRLTMLKNLLLFGSFLLSNFVSDFG